MKKLWIPIFLILSSPVVAEETTADTHILEVSIGKLALSSLDMTSYKNGPVGFAAARLTYEFAETYEADIRQLPIDQRADFFWFVMWHLGLGAHGREEFEAIVYEDCGDYFVRRLKEYIEIETKLQRNDIGLHQAKYVLGGLQHLARRKALK